MTDPITPHERINAALNIAFTWGGIEGDHHRAWCIDRMVRALTGDEYEKWVSRYEKGGEYEWDTGIAP